MIREVVMTQAPQFQNPLFASAVQTMANAGFFKPENVPATFNRETVAAAVDRLLADRATETGLGDQALRTYNRDQLVKVAMKNWMEVAQDRVPDPPIRVNPLLAKSMSVLEREGVFNPDNLPNTITMKDMRERIDAVIAKTLGSNSLDDSALRFYDRDKLTKMATLQAAIVKHEQEQLQTLQNLHPTVKLNAPPILVKNSDFLISLEKFQDMLHKQSMKFMENQFEMDSKKTQAEISRLQRISRLAQDLDMDEKTLKNLVAARESMEADRNRSQTLGLGGEGLNKTDRGDRSR